MRVLAERKATAFAACVGAHLAEAPVENNLLIGIVASLEDDGDALLVQVEKDGAIELVAVQTPPRPLVIGRGDEAASRCLAEHLASAGVSLPGVLGPRETVDAFVAAWAERSEVFGRLVRFQTLYELGELVKPDAPPGHFREAHADDEQRLGDWSAAFQEEIGVFVGVGGDAHAFVREKMREGQLFVWEDGEVVSMAGWAARTARAVRVNYVYTPPAQRRKGYAAACVAALSKRLLDEGSETCLLFADAGNATSNGVYRRLGYRPLCQFAQYDFVSR